MAEKHHVHTELHLDDHASHTLEHVKEGFHELGEKVHETQHELAGFLKGAAGMALGIELAGAVETMKSIGEEVFHAAAGMEEQEKSIRGVLMMIDEEGASLEELGKEAHELNEEFQHMAVETGASKESLISAFDEMAERTGMSTKNVKRLTEEMAQAGRAVPGGVGAMSTGFANLASGMIRAKNPIVQMIAATGMLQGTAKSVAKQMVAMSPEKAMNLGIAAIEKMGMKMKGVPLSFNETIASMKALREQIFEAMGAPLLRALGGPLGQIRDYFIENQEAVAKWAEEVGHDAGEWLKDAFAYLQTHGDEIRAKIAEAATILKEAFAAASEVAHFMYDHRSEIAAAYGISRGASIGLKVGSAVAGGGAGAGLAALGALAVVLTKVGEEGRRLAALNDDNLNETARTTAALAAARAGDIESAKKLTAAMTEANPSIRAYSQGIVHQAIEANEWNERVKHVTEENMKGADARFSPGKMFQTESHPDVAYFRGVQVNPEPAAGAAVDRDKAAAAASFEFRRALAAGDEAQANYWAKLMEAKGNLANAINVSGDDFDRATWEFIERISAFAPALASTLATRYGLEHGTGTRVDEKLAASPVQNFTGPISIHVDAKDKSEDRMILIFKKALARSGQSKTTAATATPHTAF